MKRGGKGDLARAVVDVSSSVNEKRGRSRPCMSGGEGMSVCQVIGEKGGEVRGSWPVCRVFVGMIEYDFDFDFFW